MRSLVVFVLLASVLIAGCTGDDDLDVERIPGNGPAAQEEKDGPGQGVLAGNETPEWAIGHYWVYETNLGEPFELVVAGDADDDWIVATSDVELAWFHTRQPVSYLGAVHKDNLAGSQPDGRVAFFDFPLVEGNQWTTTWDGEERTITVTQAGDRFALEAHQTVQDEDGEEEEILMVDYTYDPEAGWFDEMNFYNEEGDTTYTMTLLDHGTNWTGEIALWDAQMRRSIHGSGSTGTEIIEFDGNHDEIWFHAEYTCETAGYLLVQFIPVDSPAGNDGVAIVNPCSDLEVTEVFDGSEQQDWFFQYSSSTLFGGAQLQIWERTLQMEPFGS